MMNVTHSKASVLAVLVLYRMAPEEAPAFRTLQELLKQDQEMAAAFACILYDNSPVQHLAPDTSFSCFYVHDQSNPGLALPYQYGLDYALREQISWLLLLDQDTVVTAAYLQELLAVTRRVEPDEKVIAVVPKLLHEKLMLSPHWPNRHPNPEPLDERTGILDQKMKIFNSGSTLRVSALKESGGFPQTFPLDFLDHVVFHQLQESGGRAYLMRAGLQHDLACLKIDLVREFRTSSRTRSTMNAESRYYRQYETPRQLIIYFLRRGRLGFRMLLAGQFRGAISLIYSTLFLS